MKLKRLTSPDVNLMRSSSDRTRIAMVLDAYDEAYNGAVISTKRFAEKLRERHQVLIISTGKPAEDKVVLPRIYLPFVKAMEQMKTPLAWPFTDALEKAISSVDLVHVQFPFMLGRRAARIARQQNKPVVSTFHIQAEHLMYNIGVHWQPMIDGTYKFFVRYLYNKCDAVICPSMFARDMLIKHGLKRPAYIISNGIPPNFHPANFEREPELKDRFVVLTVGRLAPEKNQELIMEAIKRSRFRNNIQLIILGEGALQKRLQEAGATLPLPPIIKVIPSEEMSRYYNIADLIVHAAEVEVECMAVMEAMACGLVPLIAQSPRSAASQFALNEHSLFDYRNADELAAKIDYWLENKNELAAARKTYVKQAEQYKFENSLKKLENLYLQLTGKSTLVVH